MTAILSHSNQKMGVYIREESLLRLFLVGFERFFTIMCIDGLKKAGFFGNLNSRRMMKNILRTAVFPPFMAPFAPL